MNKKNLTVAVTLLTLTASCATTASLHPGSGRKFTAQAQNYEQLWTAAVRSLNEDMEIEEANKASGVIRAKKNPFFGSAGEAVAVFISPQTVGPYPIEIVVKSNLQGSLSGLESRDRTADLAARIKKNLVLPTPASL